MIIMFTRGRRRFEIKSAEIGCAGYVDGVLSVTGPNAHTVARVLLRKYSRKMREAQIVHFESKRLDLPNGTVAQNEPDRAE